MNRYSRREVLAAGAWSVGALALPGALAHAVGGSKSKPDVHVFSKHLQWLDYDGMAQAAAEVGFDGIDLTVRPGGHVTPERVEHDLPRAVDAVRRAGINVEMIVTAINDPDEPLTKSILQTAGQLGIRFYRMGYYRYDESKSVSESLKEAAPRMRDLAAMNEHFGLADSYQNHAGNGYVGAALWDLFLLLKDLDPKWIGCQYDIRHAAVEGGMSWPTTFRLLAPHINTLVAKDFQWVQAQGRPSVENCPLGQGAVDWTRYRKLLTAQRIETPISLHFEYPLGGAEHGQWTLTIDKKQVLDVMRRDLQTLRAWLGAPKSRS